MEPTSSSEKPDKTVIGYKRDTKHRIFVNRSLKLKGIKFYGFDMDYTLANYKSPQYEELAFGILRDRLVELGYPEELAKFSYEPSFPARGLWFDTAHGTILKLDQFGNILSCLRGFNKISHQETCALYPNKFVKFEEARMKIMSTLFDLPTIHLLACLVHMLQSDPNYTKDDQGVRLGFLYMSYNSIFEDVEGVVDWMHRGELKRRTLENLDFYVDKNPELIVLLEKLRENDAKVFLLTNSDFRYSEAIMSHIMDIKPKESTSRKWTSYFDYIVTDARKPIFFKEGTTLRVVDEKTGRYSIGHHMGPLETGRIYAGGSCEVFTQLIGAIGKDVLYTGDHIYGDILKSKKTVGWRTFLVIPELVNEIYVWKKKKNLFDKLQYLNNNLAEAYKDMNIDSSSKPNVANVQKEIRAVSAEMEKSYGLLGSMFRSGSRNTFFSYQAMRFADIYSFSCFNLIYYPLCYMFRAPTMLMPHESTVSHSDTTFGDFEQLEETPCSLRRRTQPNLSDSINAFRNRANTVSFFESTGITNSNLISEDQSPEKTDDSSGKD